jgi:hypothetical protein
MPGQRTHNPNIYSTILGNPLASNAIYNFVNREDGGLGPVYFFNNYLVRRPTPSPPNPPPPPPPPVYSDKIVALLNFNYIVDIRVKNTLEYYFDNVTSFTRFYIENTYGSVDKTLELLNTYYSKGYKYFIGFNETVLLTQGILQWFNDHPDTTPISTDSSSASLAYQKSLYRLDPVTPVLIELYSTIILRGKDIVYFIYDSSLPQNDLLVLYLEEISKKTGITVVLKPINGESNINIVTINKIMESIVPNENAVIQVSMITATDKFYNTFDSTTADPGYKFFELSVIPNITSTQANIYFNNILFVPTIANLCSSILWRKGYNSLGQNNYDIKTLNAMIMAYNLVLKGYIDQLGSNNNTLIFNPVTRDNETASVSYSLLVDGLFKPKIIGFQNSLGEIYIGQI